MNVDAKSIKHDIVGVIPLFFDYGVFDLGTSNSFVLMSFVNVHNLKMETKNQEWHIRPMRDTQIAKTVCKRCPIMPVLLKMPVDLIAMEIRNFDVILGMDWLSEHYTFIGYREMRVIFEMLGLRMHYFQGMRTQAPNTMTALQVCHMK